MTKKHLIQSLITLTLLLGTTIALYLYTSGYRLTKDDETQNNQIQVKRTGLIRARSIPDGANVYLNDELVTATDATIANLKPGETYKLAIVKTGYAKWEKNVEVFPELVTDITAVLVSKTPRLEPLTNTGAKNPAMAPSLSKIAFFSQDAEAPGIKVLSLIGGGLDLFKSNTTNLLQDTIYNTFSKGTKIEWSPDEKQLLVTVPEQTLGETKDNFYLVDIENKTAESTESPELLKETWRLKTTKAREDIIKNIDLPQEIKKTALDEGSMWAPDNKKFLFKNETEQEIEYKVYNMEKPIPVGEKTETLVFTLKKDDPQPQINWYADSYHLVLAEGDVETNKKGKISIIRIDGTNKIEIYNNTLHDNKVFSSPGGDKLIISTSFTTDETTNLYTLGIR